MKDSRELSRIIGLFFLFPCVLVSCQTDKDLERDRRIFSMQTKLIELEKSLNTKAEVNEKNLSRGMVEYQSFSEEMGRDLQLLQGKVQTLEHFLGVDEIQADEFASKAPEQKIAVLTTDLEHMTNRVEELEKKLETVSNTQNELFKSVESVLKAGGNKKLGSPSSSSSKKVSFSSVKEVEKAYEDKWYTHIIENYESTKKKFGKADQYDVSFFYGGSLFKLGRISEAALVFDELLNEKTKSEKLPQIYLRLGDCFRLLGKKDVALIYYEELIEKYPKDSQAKLAKEYLEQLRKI